MTNQPEQRDVTLDGPLTTIIIDALKDLLRDDFNKDKLFANSHQVSMLFDDVPKKLVKNVTAYVSVALSDEDYTYNTVVNMTNSISCGETSYYLTIELTEDAPEPVVEDVAVRLEDGGLKANHISVDVSSKDETPAKRAADLMRNLFNALIENGLLPKDPMTRYGIGGTAANPTIALMGYEVTDLAWTKFLITQADDFCNLFEKTLEKDRSVNNDKDMSIMLDNLLHNFTVPSVSKLPTVTSTEVSAKQVIGIMQSIDALKAKTDLPLVDNLDEAVTKEELMIRKQDSLARLVELGILSKKEAKTQLYGTDKC